MTKKELIKQFNDRNTGIMWSPRDIFLFMEKIRNLEDKKYKNIFNPVKIRISHTSIAIDVVDYSGRTVHTYVSYEKELAAGFLYCTSKLIKELEKSI